METIGGQHLNNLAEPDNSISFFRDKIERNLLDAKSFAMHIGEYLTSIP